MKKLAGRDIEDILQVGALPPLRPNSVAKIIIFPLVLDSRFRGHPAKRAQQDLA